MKKTPVNPIEHFCQGFRGDRLIRLRRRQEIRDLVYKHLGAMELRTQGVAIDFFGLASEGCFSFKSIMKRWGFESETAVVRRCAQAMSVVAQREGIVSFGRTKFVYSKEKSDGCSGDGSTGTSGV